MPKTPNNNNNNQFPFYEKLNQFYYKHFYNRASHFRQFALPNSLEQTYNTNYYQEYQETQGQGCNINAQQETVENTQEPIVEHYAEVETLQEEIIPEEEGIEEYYEEEEKELSLLTPEMIEIFQHSENWRIEKEKILQAEKEREEALEYIDKEDYLPKDLPTFKEYEELYSSKKALTIASLESQLDNQFRELCESENPILWPILPLNLKF